MSQHIKLGRAVLPKSERQKRLHRQLGEFAGWMQRPKDTAEIRRDRRQPLPPSMLPMVF
ncbi:hypothetical protein [Flavobacterium lindanitolerans]|uniref:hypothetical protein n=1 Tax=Flavobacterium lindanitolerans TaxID=428988 RepID=UPI0023EFB4F6|nr:hypothetical protein [Flavobacterium lindanitolerans]